MAKKPKVERTFGLEIGMTETNQGKQVVIREAISSSCGATTTAMSS